MDYFVSENHIIRKIWGKADIILLIFAGAAAEFALNKAVDWLYFTGKLPADPLGRLFSTVDYARKIILSEKSKAYAAIEKIHMIHTGVEKARGFVIPDSAYRDVLFMLIHYSITSFETLDRKLTEEEKENVVKVFYEVGTRMHLKDLPDNYNDWQKAYLQQQQTNLVRGAYTIDLYKQYKKHLGPIRYFILLESQKLVAGKTVRELLQLQRKSVLSPAIPIYNFFREKKAEWFIQAALLPNKYKQEVKQMNLV